LQYKLLGSQQVRPVQICRTLQTPFENVLHDLRVLRQETFRIALAGKSGNTDQQKLVAQFL